MWVDPDALKRKLYIEVLKTTVAFAGIGYLVFLLATG